MTHASPAARPSGLTGPQRSILWGSAALVLLLPMIAMGFTREVDWSAGDFVVFGTMLAGLCVAIELSVRLLRSRSAAALAIAAAVLVFLLIWAELAVGILD